MGVLKEESPSTEDDTPQSRKSVSVSQIKLVEICAHCGAPVTDKDTIFCSRCSAHILATPSGEEPPIIRPVVPKSMEKTPVPSPGISPDTGNITTEELNPPIIYPFVPKPKEKTLVPPPWISPDTGNITTEELNPPIIYPFVPKPKEKTLVPPPWISPDTGNTTIQPPDSIRKTENPIVTGSSGLKIIIIIAVIAMLLIVLVMIVMLMFTFWASLY
jgi:hypothetical protein